MNENISSSTIRPPNIISLRPIPVIPGLPAIDNGTSLLNNTSIVRPQELVTGLLHRGTKGVLASGSKVGKTCILLHLALSVATGTRFLRWNTTRGKVLYLNFEILPAFMKDRLATLMTQLRITSSEGLDIWNLRGKTANFDALLANIIKEVEGKNYSLIILDPIYKLMNGQSENMSGGISALCHQLERLCEKSGAAIVFAHHFTKGNAKKKAVIDRMSGSGDMVLISPNKTHCETAFKAYLNKLTDLQLPYHAPESTCVYGAKHWEHKSKSPYCWSGRKWFGCVPWVQFVGYQIRYDGLVRPRKDSVRKQAKKIQETTQKLVGGLFRASQEQQILASRGQVHASLRAKLTAQGVGRVNWNFVNGPRSMCWAAGFKGLHEKPFIPGSLRFLDHARTQQIRRFSAVRIPYGNGTVGQYTNRTSPIGYAFSYDGQFTNTGGRQLIENPWHPHNLMEKGQSYLYYNAQSFYKWCRKTIDKL